MIIDVSYANGSIDWDVASKEIEGAIIRAGFGKVATQEDQYFKPNVKGAISNGLQIGFYWFSYANNVETALVEAKVCESIIAPYLHECSLGVFFDWEYVSANYCQKTYGKRPTYKEVQEMTTAFIEYFQKKGYKAGYYANLDFSRTYYSGYNAPADSLFWLAYYSKQTPPMYCNYQQYSSKGEVSGIHTQVDLNLIRNQPATLESTCRGDGVRIRTAPRTDAKVVGYLYSGDKVSVYSDDGWGWSKIGYKGITGWVFNQYLTHTNKSKPKTVIVNGANVNVRSAPYLGGAPLAQANKGDTFELVAILKNGWLDVGNKYIYYDQSYISIK